VSRLPSVSRVPRIGSGAGEWAVATGIGAVVLGPALRPGYLLHYDLVSVPRPVLGDDALGLGDRLPRAVPWDAVVAVAARMLPDDVVVQVAGLLALAMAGAGAARLARHAGIGRWAALLVAIWNPFVLEQLAIGHVPHLLGYGAVPWVALGMRGMLAGRDRAWSHLTAACLVGSCTPGGGLLCLGTALVTAAAFRPPRTHPDQGKVLARRLAIGWGTAAATQAPWVVAGLTHPAGALSAPAGVTAFATRAETGLGVAVDVLGLGGLWTSGPLPTSRTTWLAVASTVLLGGLALAGVRDAVRATPRRPLVTGAVLITLGYFVALLPHLPGGHETLAWLLTNAPGAGLLRDGHRWLAWPALGLSVLAGFGVGTLGRLAVARTSNPLRAVPVLVAVAAAVVAVAPDLAFGLGGRLRPVSYPSDWARVRTTLNRAPDADRVLVLPWQPFRRFPWSGQAPVLDPAPRTLPRPVLVDDALSVRGVRLPAEGAGSRAIDAALADDVLSAGELDRLGVGWVLVEHRTPGRLPRLPPGTAEFDGPDLHLVRLSHPQSVTVDTRRAQAVTAAHLSFAALAAAATLGHLGIPFHRRGYPRL
jgi:hypothetical protein